ncbi:MAG: polyamine ABC transporter substrate-binding protein [Halocynthiibacter sp.]
MEKTLTTALAGLFLTATVASANEVRIYNWSDYIGEEVIAKFEAETGIKVIYDVFDSNEILESKLLAGGTGYDVVVPTGSFMARQIKAGVFQKLDQSKLTNKEHQWPLIQERLADFDPDNSYSINYMWGTSGLGVNVPKVKEILGDDAPIDSLALIMDPKNMEKLQACGVHFLDAPDEHFPAAMAYLGFDPNSHDEGELEKATEALQAVAPYVQKFHSSEMINALANGDICVAFGWSGDLLQARDRADEAENGVEITYTAPIEGAMMWFDQMAIPADAPNVDAAHTFIDFMMRPEIAAENSNYIYYPNGNLSAQPLLEEEVRTDTAIYPSDETMARLFTKSAYERAFQRKVTRAWTKVKSGY